MVNFEDDFTYVSGINQPDGYSEPGNYRDKLNDLKNSQTIDIEYKKIESENLRNYNQSTETIHKNWFQNLPTWARVALVISFWPIALLTLFLPDIPRKYRKLAISGVAGLYILVLASAGLTTPSQIDDSQAKSTPNRSQIVNQQEQNESQAESEKLELQKEKQEKEQEIKKAEEEAAKIALEKEEEEKREIEKAAKAAEKQAQEEAAAKAAEQARIAEENRIAAEKEAQRIAQEQQKIQTIYSNPETTPTPVQQPTSNPTPAPTPTGVVKLSNSGICHSPGSTYYSRTKNYTPYNTLDECLRVGRLPLR